MFHLPPALHRFALLVVVAAGIFSDGAAAQIVVNVRTTVEVIAFSRDDSFALVSERFETDASASARFLVVDANGIRETLPLSERVKMGTIADGIPLEACEATHARLRTLAKELVGITVVGLCSHPQRPLVKSTQQPRAVVGDAALGRLHAKLGFVGQTWISPRKTFAVVIGQDFNGNPRIVTTALPADAPAP